MAWGKNTFAVFAGAAALRLSVFFFFPTVIDFLTTQVEISTPTSSFKRLKEGLFLYERSLSPYDGGVFHQAPLLLVIFGFFPASLVFTAIDLANGLALKIIADRLKSSSPRFKPINGTVIAAAFLFNPFTILSCLGQSTYLFTNLAIAQAALAATTANLPRAMTSLAFGTYLTMYPSLLIPPVLLLQAQATGSTVPGRQTVLEGLAWFAVTLLALLGSTVLITGDIGDFIRSCYGFQLTVPDLTPNIGLWWYFFTEIFDSFREFFIGVFWLHMASYVGGLTIRLYKEPLFVLTTLLGLFAVFKPYPSVADVSLYFGFLPMYHHIIPLTRYTFIASSVILYSSLLGPAFHYLWIYAGSGNANFFFAITLVWSLGLAILIGDTLFAVLRDEWEVERPDMKGKDVHRI
ncbi:hypothetical protein DV736_g2588, partial [Chaetothyriales sp. CBS 134916]